MTCHHIMIRSARNLTLLFAAITALVSFSPRRTVIAATPSTQIKTQVIAHRGYWDTPGSAQNSLTSLHKADSIGVYGSECDVYLCPDGELVVHHDDRVTEGGDTLYIERTPSSILKRIKLSNGETIPTFDAYLDVFKSCQKTKLIIELKVSKNDKVQSGILAAKILAKVKEAGLEDRVEYITFNLDALHKLIELNPQAKTAYLSGNIAPAELKPQGCTGIDYDISTMKRNEVWFDEARQAGLEINVWTVNNPDDMRYLIEKGVNYITTDKPELLQSILKEYDK